MLDIKDILRKGRITHPQRPLIAPTIPGDILQEPNGAHSTAHSEPVADALPSGRREMAAGILGGIGKLFEPSDVHLPVIAPVANPNQINLADIRQQYMPHYRYGGKLKPGQTGVVGEAGPEIIKVHKNGATVIPNPQDVPVELPTLTAPVVAPMIAHQPVNEVPNSPPNTIIPESVNLPVPSPLQRAQQKYETALGTEEKPSKFLSGLYLALQGIGQVLGQNNQPIRSLADARKGYKVGQAQAELDPLLKMRDADTADAYRKAQTNTIPIDDEARRIQLENQRQAVKDKLSAGALTKLYAGKIFDKSNKVHRALAQKAGLDPDTMESWDFSNPVKSTVAGETYQYDRVSGEWHPTNLPKEAMVPLELTIPGQKPRVFNVPESKAAGIASSLQAAGMQIEAAATRQKSQQDFTVKQMQLANDLKKEIANHQALLDSGKAAEAEASKARILGLQTQLQLILKNPDDQ